MVKKSDSLMSYDNFKMSKRWSFCLSCVILSITVDKVYFICPLDVDVFQSSS